MDTKHDLSQVPDMYYPPSADELILEQVTGYSQDLGDDQLRMRFPFLPINPPVNAVNAVILVTATPTKLMPVPSGARLVRFSSNQQYFVSRQGAEAVTADISDGTAPIQNPQGWYDCTGVQSFSIYCATNNAVVTAEFYVQK